MYHLKIFMESFLSLFAIMRLAGMSTKNPVSIIVFLIILYIFVQLHSDKVEGHVAPGDMTLATILSVLFMIFTLSARYPVILGGMTSTLFCAGILLLTGVGLLITYYYLIIWFLQSASLLKVTGNGYSYASRRISLRNVAFGLSVLLKPVTVNVQSKSISFSFWMRA